MTQPTPQQEKAIHARGNLLVVAGAGAGKTRTLVQRCITWLLNEENPGSLDEILMVTFTEAAAAEMRKRIRETLEEKWRQDPQNARLAEQIALLDIARISTLHSFCFQLVREHFHALGLDPQVSVLPDETVRLLARETMDALFEEIYSDRMEHAEIIQRLIAAQSGGWDKPIRDLIQRLHAYTQTLRDPEKWFEDQLNAFGENDPVLWELWLVEALAGFKEFWLLVLHAQSPENVVAQRCALALARFSKTPTRAEAADIFEIIFQADQQWPHGTKTKFRPAIEKIFEEATFLSSLCKIRDENDPLKQDWDWTRPQIIALLELARKFSEQFSAAKRELAGLDFQDLEQFALKLLREGSGSIAGQYRRKFRLIFVDEYQDINAAQDEILKALSRDGDEANRFLVGDVKQSIYRFRLADPRIFLEYQQSWNGAVSSQVIPLSDNFRSHEAILNFVNPLFATLMKKSIGGIDYDESARLAFGNREGRAALTTDGDASARIEFHLRVTGEAGTDNDNADELDSLSAAEKEARLVARRLLELKNDCAPVWKNGKQEPVQWSDMVILLRSPRNKAEAYAKEFSRLGIPLNAARGGFYDSLEISDLLNLLRLLDNPLQDLPLLAVLRSPFVALSLNELAAIRAGHRHGRFWTTLARWQETHREAKENSADAKLVAKVEKFVTTFERWRKSAGQTSLSHLLETILDETHYGDWLVTQSRGPQRGANVARLLELARQFDSLQGQGLFRFLRFIDSQQEAEIEVEPVKVDSENAVRLMSIHQSKGLEFPVVVLADIGKRFNNSDLKEKIILDEVYGLCPQVTPPGASQSYPSLPYWLASRRQKTEALGEELRLLYVATTRAVDRLILVGTASEKARAEKWPKQAEANFGTPEIASATSFLGWLGPWLVKNFPELSTNDSGEAPQLRWTIYNENDSRLRMEGAAAKASVSPVESAPPEALEALKSRLGWEYPFAPATNEPAKTSVSALRRRDEEWGEESKPLFAFRQKPKQLAPDGKLSAAEIGTAHHTFLEFLSLNGKMDEARLQAEAQRLGEKGVLSASEVASMDFSALASFWNSETGQQILAKADFVQREHPFTSRLNEKDFARLKLHSLPTIPAGEFLVLQGVIDLAVILPDEVWLLDFKTDQIKPADLPARMEHYRPQVMLYSDAMEKIYNRPVTSRWLHFLALEKTVGVAAK